MDLKLLPLGSIVRLKAEPQADVMLIGYFPRKENKTHLYLAVPYPMGALFNNAAIFVDEDMMDSLVFEGYKTEETETVISELPKAITESANIDFENVKENLKQAEQENATT